MAYFKVFLEWITPVIIQLANKLMPVILADVKDALKSALIYFIQEYKKNRKKETNMNIVFNVKTADGAIATGATVALTGKTTTTVDATTGQAIFTDLVEGATVTYVAGLDEYTSQSDTLTVNADPTTVNIALQAKTDPAIAAANTISTAAIAAATTAALTSSNATSFFATLKGEITDLLTNVRVAIKAESLGDVQNLSAELTTTYKARLTAGIAWYVSERSKLNKRSDFWKWVSYTSMVGVLYTLRNDFATVLDEALEFVEKKLS